MRELVRGNLSPLRGEGEASSRCRPSRGPLSNARKTLRGILSLFALFAPVRKLPRSLVRGCASWSGREPVFARQAAEAWTSKGQTTSLACIFHRRTGTGRRSADFQSAVVRVSNPLRAAMFPILCRLEVGDTAGSRLETCATKPSVRRAANQFVK